MAGAHLGDALCGDRLGQRTARAHIGHQNGLVRVEDFRGLGHEKQLALHDYQRLDSCGVNGELQAVAHHIGDVVIDFRRHLIMRQHHRAALLFQAVDRQNIGAWRSRVASAAAMEGESS